MYNILAIFGKSSSGKDTLKKAILESFPNSTTPIVGYTTRPKRDNEIEGIDYHFISLTEACDLILSHNFAEYHTFNSWVYGTKKNDLDIKKINVGVFSKYAIADLLLDKELNVIPIFLDTDDKTRLLRSLKREKNPDCEEICRRFFSDKEDFKKESFSFPYTTLNGNNSIKDLIESIKPILSKMDEIK